VDAATAALIASGVSSVVAVSAAVYAGRTQQKLANFQAEREDLLRRSEAKVVLDKYRAPLLSAAWELGHLIDNIRRGGIAAYVNNDSPRRRAAILTAAFRFAQYFGWSEVVRVETQLLRFNTEHDTRVIATLIGSITWIFASNSPNLNVRVGEAKAISVESDVAIDASMRSGAWLMLWSEDQRGIGELMRLEPEHGSPRARGYASFVRDYDASTRRRLEGYAMQAISSACTDKDVSLDSGRLRLLQLLFLGLVLQLDEARVYPPYPGNWIGRTWHDYANPPPEVGQSSEEKDVRKELGDLPNPWAPIPGDQRTA
jgi:hypothetical protein